MCPTCGVLLSPDDQVGDHETEPTVASLGDEGAAAVYDLSSWRSEPLTRLRLALASEGIEATFTGETPWHAVYTGTVLVVRADDKARVDELIEHLGEPVEGVELPAAEDDTGGDDDEAVDSEELMEAVGDAFVAADRLAHQPRDELARLELQAAAEVLEGSAPPYGIDDESWARLSQPVVGFATDLDTDGVADDEAVAATAVAIRERLRPYV